MLLKLFYFILWIEANTPENETINFKIDDLWFCLLT